VREKVIFYLGDDLGWINRRKNVQDIRDSNFEVSLKRNQAVRKFGSTDYDLWAEDETVDGYQQEIDEVIDANLADAASTV
jgi:hypothetical protein